MATLAGCKQPLSPPGSRQELEAGLGDVLRSPVDEGTLEMIVARPAVDVRTVLEVGRLELEDGLCGDTWWTRGEHLDAGRFVAF